MHPLLSARSSRKFSKKALSVIWILGLTLGMVQFANTKAVPFMIANQTNYDCKETWTRDESRAFTMSVFVITFALPMSILIFVYSSIGNKMFHHETPGNADVARDKVQQASKTKVW